ncbi:hypothetical protein ACHAQH_002611 [Verticillium albo-atrum]
MGQLKWHYYRRPQRLLNLERMDAATRSIWGSLMLLLSRNWRRSITLGGILMIASLFFGAFLQNTINQELKSFPTTNETAFLPVNTDFTTPFNHDELQMSNFLVAPMVIQAALAKGWSYYEGTSPEVTSMASHLPIDCPSGNCTWTNVATLRLQSECRKAPFEVKNWTSPDDGLVRPYAQSTELNVSMLLTDPADPSVRVISRLFMQPSSSAPSGSAFTSRQRRVPIVAHLAVIGNYYTDFTSFEAAECILYWQAEQYPLVTMESGRLLNAKAAVHNETEEAIPPSHDQNMTLIAPWPCNVNTTSPAPADSCSYHISSKAHRGLANSLKPYLSGEVASFRSTMPSSGEENTFTTFEDPMTELLLWSWANSLPPLNASQKDIDEALAEDPGPLLSVLTSYIKNTAYFATCALRASSDERQHAFGTVFRAEMASEFRS